VPQLDETAQDIVRRFGLTPHPEGGYYREVYRSGVAIEHPAIPPGERSQPAVGPFIYYLLPQGQSSPFHRVKWSDEIWHLYAGGPLELHLIDADGAYRVTTLQSAVDGGEPVAVVPAGWWQAARPAPGTRWALCGCTVTPGFDFADFEMPAADELLARFPAHAETIRALTRG